MKKFSIFLVLLAVQFAAYASPTDSLSSKPRLDWSVRADYIFDNAEYTKSHDLIDDSSTLHAIRLSPSIGVFIPQRADSIRHRVRLGLDIMKQAGDGLPIKDAFKELQLYYGISADFRNGATFEAYAGAFPRSCFGGYYKGPAFDRRVLYLDPNVEGMLFKYQNASIRAELGLDWLGMFADKEHPERRERFQILSSGDWTIYGPLHLIWTAAFYHFACNLVEHGVVDNHMVNPMLEWRPKCWFDLLSVSAGGIFTYQWDRLYSNDLLAPAGFYSVQRLEKWHVCLHNQTYYGSDLQPMYSKYGSDLYFGQPMFRTLSDSGSLADELTLAYNPHICDWLDLVVAATFSFGSPNSSLDIGAYRGCRQLVSLRVNLERFPR